MNSRVSGIVKNIGHAFSANLITLIISFVVSMIVPKALGVEEYGYWQLYVFYSAYVGIFHFGLIDGIYLRYGGMEYDDLNKPLLHSQYVLLTLMQLIISVAICIGSFFFIGDSSRIFVMLGLGICCVLLNPRIMLLYVLQATGRLKEYAKNTIAEKSIYAGIVLTMVLLFEVRQFQYLVLADLIAKAFTAVTFAYVCKDIVITKGIAMRDSLTEALANISVGIKLLFAQLAGNLILGIVRFIIERAWDVPTFGKVSLSLTVSNLMMVFISAVGVVMFPVLKRMNPENRGANYKKLRILLVVPILGLLLACQPARWLLLAWLPKYADSAVYLVMLFPLCLFEGKVSVLTNNYLKALRLEKTMMVINLVSMLVSIVVSIFCAYVLKSLPLCVLSILFLSALRCVLSEIIIAKKIAISVFRDIVYEILLVIIFVSSGWFLSGWASALVYAGAYVMYLIVQRGKIRDVVNMILGR